jgi:sigma-B regulation protein RsbU (phosphoserine phosphatase)
MKITLTPKFYMRLSLVLAVLLWLIATLIDVLQLLATRSDVKLGIDPVVTNLLEAVFLIMVFFLFPI